jgi:hypothetical protein
MRFKASVQLGADEDTIWLNYKCGNGYDGYGKTETNDQEAFVTVAKKVITKVFTIDKPESEMYFQSWYL